MAIRHSITLSTSEPNNEVGNLKIRQGDEQTQTLVANITENGVPKPFVGLQPFFCAKLGQTAGLGIIEQKVTGPMNPANGTLEYVMQPEDWQQLGRQTAYFSFRKMVNDHEWTEQFSTRDFNYNVIKSAFSEGLREVKKDGSTYIWTIEDMLRLFKEYIATGKIEWENYKNDERTIWETYRLSEKINWDDYKLREKNEWKNYKDDEKTTWEKFVEDNREFLENADPGGKIILELLGARGGAQTLGERLDSEKAEVTAQLAHTEHYMNQLQNVFMGKGLEPYWIETAVEFGFTHGGVPEGISNYEGGNYYLEVSGSEGDNFVTVTGGNIGHAGQTNSWASVIKDDSGNWKPYRVLGTNGVDQVNIYPPLKTNISNGELANVHDAKVGQHYTERGYFALAQHIYNYSPLYASRNKVISKFNPTIDSIEENKWKHVDANPIISVPSVVNSSRILIKEGNNTLYLEGAGGKTLESTYELELKGKKGFVETHVSTRNNQMIVEFYLDDELVEAIEAKPSVLNKIKFHFGNADRAKLKVYLQGTTAWSDVSIGRTTWYQTNETSITIIPPHSRLVYLGDSWGEYHNCAVSRELSRLLTSDSGTTVDVFNDSKGGMTSKWGIAWFEEYVIKNRPTHVIIEFFTNDLNSIFNSLPYNYLAPDGQTYSGKIASSEEWLNNIKQMANISKRHGIQPIIVAPALVEGDSQILSHLIASNLMFD